MRSEIISLEGGLLGYNHEALQCLSRPYGTARIVSGHGLSTMEAALLSYFRRHAGRTLSREELADQVWKQRHYYGSRTIDQTVSKLRKKLRHDCRILSVWSAGYRFEENKQSGETREFKRR